MAKVFLITSLYVMFGVIGIELIEYGNLTPLKYAVYFFGTYILLGVLSWANLQIRAV